MAKQRYGINDAYQGTVGTVIGYEWRGKWCLRARPRMVRNPRTEAQQVNREVFKCVVREAGRLKGLLRMGLRALALEMHLTEGNLFVKRNKQCFWLDGEGVLQADWEQVLVADGPVVPVADPVVETRHVVAAVETQRAASPHATMNVAPPVETRGRPRLRRIPLQTGRRSTLRLYGGDWMPLPTGRRGMPSPYRRGRAAMS